MARKRSEPGERLARKLSFRLTEADFHVYSQRFQASGLTQSEFFRHCVLTNRTEFIVDARRPLLLHAINKAGYSLNQVARAIQDAKGSGQLNEALVLTVIDHLIWIEVFLQGMVGRAD